jgi:Protein of unknown function (DUF2971)
MKCRFAIFLAGSLGAMLSGCASVAVDPDRHFQGLGDIVTELSDKGTLDVFLVHGMAAQTEPNYAKLIAQLQKRMGLKWVSDDPERKLADQRLPEIRLRDQLLFKTLPEWSAAAPTLRVERYRTSSGRTVNLYLLDYWSMLARIKCRYIVGNDTKLLGSSTISDYCDTMGFSRSWPRLSAAPASINKAIKVGIMEWGLADAIIVSSELRQINREAVAEAMGIELAEALALDSDNTGTLRPSGIRVDLVRRLSEKNDLRFAVISESLGSYVILDALGSASRQVQPPLESTGGLTADEREDRMPAEAVAICGASQIHMFANQVPLLRLSEITVDRRAGPSGRGLAADALEYCDKFDRNIGKKPGTPGFAARQIVAYHDPSDLLTYYLSDPPEAEGANNRITNVVVPFAKTWIPLFVANPIAYFAFQGDVEKWGRLFAFAWSQFNIDTLPELIAEAADGFAGAGTLSFDEAFEKQVFNLQAGVVPSDELMLKGFLSDAFRSTLKLYWPATQYFVSLSESMDQPLMWSHYADRHRGVCLIFRLPEGQLSQNYQKRKRSSAYDTPGGIALATSFGLPDQFTAAPIQYRDGVVPQDAFNCFPESVCGLVDGEVANSQIHTKSRQHLLEKDVGWKYERESRLVLSPPTAWLAGGQREYTAQQRLFHYEPTQTHWNHSRRARGR